MGYQPITSLFDYSAKIKERVGNSGEKIILSNDEADILDTSSSKVTVHKLGTENVLQKTYAQALKEGMRKGQSTHATNQNRECYRHSIH